MKLIVVLSVIACGYAAKLDRTYLPPSSAATAGGSPGAITAPDSGFGLGPASAEFGQDLPIGPASRPSFVKPISNVPTGQGSNQATGFQGSRSFFGQPGNQGSDQPGFPGTNSFKDNEIGNDDSSRPTSQFSSQGSSTPFGQAQDFTQEEQRPERPQAAADRNAEILKYVNENNGDSYEYSYETSNGISAGESGVATNGVMAQGSFAYTGDDGKPYSITYTADENGFQPQGEHLPTPHPIPEEILKSIEENARAAASGIQEGAYRPEEYESESSPQQNGNGAQIPSQQGPIFPGASSQRKPDQGFRSFPGAQQASQNQYSQGDRNDYPESSGQQIPSQQPSGNAFDTPPRSQRPGGDGYNYNRPSLGQDQRGSFQRPSQAFGNKKDNEMSKPASQPNQLNQPQGSQIGRQAQGFKNQFDNQGRPSNQYSPQQNSQTQGENGYNYNRPQTISSGSQSPSNQRGQPQKLFPGFGNNNQDLSAQPKGLKLNANQQRPQFSQNQFGSHPQKYSPSQTGQNQRENGYTYNQPQKPQNSAQGPQGSQDSSIPGNKQTNKNVFGQQSSQASRDFNQAQRPALDSNNTFGRPQGPSNQYSQGPRGQDQGGNGYNYNQPQKSGSQPGQSPTFTQGITSQFGPQARPNNQFGQSQRTTQGPFSGNQQRPTNKFPSGQGGQDQDENGYYYNRPQTTQTQGPFGQRPQFGAPNQSGFSPRPTSSFDSNNQEARPGPMKPSFGKNIPKSNADREQYSPENKPFGSIQSDSRPLGGSDSSRPSDKFQPSLAPASQFRPQQPSQTRPIATGPSGQDAPNQIQNKPSSFGPSTGNAPTQSQNRPSSFGPSSQNADQTLAQGYQYGPGKSNQPKRPGSNSNGQGNETPGATKGPGSEFGGPRQPPSFSPEEGYKY